MKKGAEAILKSIVGDAGLESLSKAIFRRQTNTVADPMELYLPLMVVPRAILSWLVKNIQPLKVGDNADLKLPGREDVTFHIMKRASDVYDGEFVQGGKIIHAFEKQTLPSIGGHLMTVFEDYGHLDDKPVVMDRKEAVKEHEELIDAIKSPSKKDDKEQLEQQSKELEQYRAGTEDSSGIVRTIMSMNGISVESNESGAVTAMMQLASVRSLTESIGKLVDALVHKRPEGMDKKEIKPDDGKVKESEMPQPKKDTKDVVQEGQSLAEVRRDAALMTDEKMAEISAKDYKNKEVKAGKEARDAEPKKESISKDEIPASKSKPLSWNNYFRHQVSRKQKMAEARRKNHEAVHGKPDPKAAMNAAVAAVERAAKKPEEKVEMSPGSGYAAPKGGMSKEELGKAGAPQKPGGAGIPQAPKAPQGPKPPVGPSSKPSAAQKQTQASSAGQQAKPAAGSQNRPMSMNPAQQSMKPKMSMKGEVAGYSTSNPPGKEIPSILDVPANRPKRHLRDLIKPPVRKSEQAFVSEQELFQKCEHCGRSEFEKTQSGVRFSPCACFVALTKDDEGRPTHFVALRKVEGGYTLRFDPSADQDAVKAFLLLMKSRLLIKKRFGL